MDVISLGEVRTPGAVGASSKRAGLTIRRRDDALKGDSLSSPLPLKSLHHLCKWNMTVCLTRTPRFPIIPKTRIIPPSCKRTHTRHTLSCGFPCRKSAICCYYPPAISPPLSSLLFLYPSVWTKPLSPMSIIRGKAIVCRPVRRKQHAGCGNRPDGHTK